MMMVGAVGVIQNLMKTMMKIKIVPKDEYEAAKLSRHGLSTW